ncbi:hypothetical protein ABZ890_39000 [Streptomyces sp. NPDC046984]|uniref:hypothetical protein n=1 Tax=Streptomyces sp. NPDC046984 TaxID=3155138 RepID=UPI00340FE771
MIEPGRTKVGQTPPRAGPPRLGVLFLDQVPICEATQVDEDAGLNVGATPSEFHVD